MASSQRGRSTYRTGRPGVVQASYEDDTGRQWVTLVPVGCEDQAEAGIPVGPPDTRPLGLPEEVDIQLNNGLFRRGLITKQDLRGRAHEVTAALQLALKTSTTTILNLYAEAEHGKSEHPTE